MIMFLMLLACVESNPGHMSEVRNSGRDISFPIFIRKEIETRKLERKSKQQMSRLNDLLYSLNDIIISFKRYNNII